MDHKDTIVNETTDPDKSNSSHFVQFGDTDLYVSPLCQGTAFRNLPRDDDPTSLRVLKHCLELGINFFDSSNIYGWGGSETLLGKAISGLRDRVVICTKVDAYEDKTDETLPPRAAYSTDFLIRRIDGALTRLRTDYIDLYLLHTPDHVTPAEQIVEAMSELVQAGKIRHWGVSNHCPTQVAEFLDQSASTGRPPISGIEEYYNIAGSRVDADGQCGTIRLEQQMFPLLRRARLGLLAFSPLDAGDLAPGHDIEDGSALGNLVSVLDRIAVEMGVSRPQVCIAWVLSHDEVTAVLAGSESPQHVDENLAGTRLVLPSDVLAKLNEASARYRSQIVPWASGP